MVGYIIVTDTVRNQITVLQNFGIRDYFDANTTPIRGEYAARLNAHNKEIDVLGLGLSHLRKDFGAQLESWASYGRVRILLIDSSAQQAVLANKRDYEENQPIGTICADVEEWLRETASLRAKFPVSFQVRLYTCLPTITLVRVGKEAFWSPYLMRRGSSSTPTMLVHQGGLLFDVVADHFNQIWASDELSKPAPGVTSSGAHSADSADSTEKSGQGGQGSK